MPTALPQPNELTFPQIGIGDVWEFERTLTEADSNEFARLSGDFSPLHVDEDYARSTEFGGRVVHGMLLASLFSQLVGMWLPGRHALYLGHDLSFRRPVLVGETVKVQGKVVGKNAATRTLTLATEIRNLEGKVVVSGTAKVKSRDVESIAAVTAELRERRNDYQRVAVVTGASRGIGAQIAKTLAGKGIAVGVNYLRNQDSANNVVATIRKEGGAAFAVQGDVRSADAMQQAVQSVQDEFGRVDYVVNCAIGELRQVAFIDMEWDDFQGHLDSQLKGPMHVMKAAYPALKSAGGGAVVNLLSQVVAGIPPARMADYVSSKYALMGFTKALAAEWASDNIRVNMVSPGLMQTDLTQHYSERIFKLEANRTPLGRIAQPQDVSSAVAYLLSSEAGFLTGINLFVTGGQVM